jgi:hypothetical protein
MFAWSSWAHPGSVEAGTTWEGGALASLRSVGVCSASHCGGGHVSGMRRSSLCSIGRRGLSQPLCWLARQVRALLWALFAWSSSAQPATVVAGTTGEGFALASIQSFDVSQSANMVAGRKLWALLWPLLARLVFAQPATVEAGTTGEDSTLFCSLGRRGLSQPL